MTKTFPYHLCFNSKFYSSRIKKFKLRQRKFSVVNSNWTLFTS